MSPSLFLLMGSLLKPSNPKGGLDKETFFLPIFLYYVLMFFQVLSLKLR
jgi:hypothetical protein